ncbi:MAG: ATP-binding protein, partial [Anaerolineaceae bacterium]|nr:ATP-binding protein [Anaerolineaceae bacterium]
MIETIIVNPDPKRLIEGLRDTGYNFCMAVADLIDNSIAAEATRVDVRIQMDYLGKIDLMIADNGCGMNRDQLIAAMKYGSPPRSNPRSLGKFGLGLKTASTAFCKRLSVISRADCSIPAFKATWDLEHVAQKGAWELLISDPESEELDFLEGIAMQERGTVVRWEEVDRLLKEYSDPAGRNARNALDRRIKELVEHVSMVYQRFLNDSDQRESQNIQMWINGEKIQPWDPFCIDEAELTAQTTMPLGFEDNEDVLGEFTVRA